MTRNKKSAPKSKTINGVTVKKDAVAKVTIHQFPLHASFQTKQGARVDLVGDAAWEMSEFLDIDPQDYAGN